LILEKEKQMSGGRHDYGYFRLIDLADSIREFEEENSLTPSQHKPTRERVIALLNELADICHDVEWIDSGDYDDEEWNEVVRKLDVLNKL